MGRRLQRRQRLQRRLQLVWLHPGSCRRRSGRSRFTSSRPTRWSSSRWSPRGWMPSLDRCGTAAAEQGMPITPHKLTPEIEDSFWVNLIGKGYPAPRQQVPLVHRAAEDPPIEQVHPRRRARERRGHPRARHAEGREPEAGRHDGKHEARRGSATGSARTRACRTRSSTRRSRTGPTTTSGST